MRKKLALNEELNRMKRLMEFSMGEHSHDVLAESNIKNIKKKVIKEQEETVTDKYGEYDFGASFSDNYIIPKKETYEPIIKNMIEDYKKAIAAGKTLEEIVMSVESSASSRRASNRYTESKPPDHDYGGLLKGGWVKKSEDKDDKLRKFIPDGNKFLAQKRGEELKKIIIQSLNTAGIKIPSNKVNVNWKVSDSGNPKEQYVRVLVKGLFKGDIPQETPLPYSILVQWYKIGGSQTPYILIGPESNNVAAKKGGYLRLWNALQNPSENWSMSEKFRQAVENSDDSVKVAGFNTNTSGKFVFKAFGVLENYDKSDGHIFYYKDRDTWMEQVKKMNTITPRGSSLGILSWGGEVDRANRPTGDSMFEEKIYSNGSYDEKSGQARFTATSGEEGDKTFFGLKPSSGEKKFIKDIKSLDHLYGDSKAYYYGEPTKLQHYYSSMEATQPEPTEPRIK